MNEPREAARAMVDFPRVRHVHLIAVGGVAMAALAGMLRARGCYVTGSDENVYPPMSLMLERLGIPVLNGYRPEHLHPRPDLVVVGNKVSRGNAEVQALLASDIPYVSLPEALGRYFIAGHHSLVVAGTHGKTTSTAMLAWVLERAGLEPSFLVGGESLDFGSNFKLGGGSHFVVEGDEYDSAFFDKGPKFLHYRPNTVLLTAVEFDHADIYRDLEAVKVAFRRLMEIVPRDGMLAVASDFPHAVEVARSAPVEAVTFGGGGPAEWQIDDLRDTGEMTEFAVRRRGVRDGALRLRSPGVINARNALGVYVIARALGLPPARIADALAAFRGVARRQEHVGTFGGVVLIDDFAHHPTAVAGTLAALRQRHPGRRLWALFEPRSNTSRRRVFQQDYGTALASADRVLVAAVFQKESDAVAAADLFSPAQLVADLEARGIAAASPDSADAMAGIVAADVQPGDVVVMMSNGDFGGLRTKLAARLRARFPDPGSVI